jgi:hypothetical protein
MRDAGISFLLSAGEIERLRKLHASALRFTHA